MLTELFFGTIINEKSKESAILKQAPDFVDQILDLKSKPYNIHGQ